MSLKIFTGKRNVKFGESIAKHLGIWLGKIYHHNFPSGESFCQFKENIRGDDVFRRLLGHNSSSTLSAITLLDATNSAASLS